MIETWDRQNTVLAEADARVAFAGMEKRMQCVQ